MLDTVRKIAKPVVEFNCSDPKHRNYFHKFLTTYSWKDCPVQFALTGQYTDIPRMIQSKLVLHYLNKEFQ